MNRTGVSRPSILFVCTANIIRSPMASAMCRVRLMMSDADWRQWRVDSAGTWATPGRPPVLEAQQVMSRRGLDISLHRSRLVSADLLRRFQLVLVMESHHKESILVEFPDYAERVYLLSEMAGESIPVADPIGGTLFEFESTANEIDRLLTTGWERLTHLARPVVTE